MQVLADATVSLITERRVSPPWGLAGGEPGAVGENWLLPGGDEVQAERLPDKCTIQLRGGDVLQMLTPRAGSLGGAPSGVSGQGDVSLRRPGGLRRRLADGATGGHPRRGAPAHRALSAEPVRVPAMGMMSDQERDAFLGERRVGVLAVGRDAAGPLVAPIWYQYAPGVAFRICMGGSSAKAARLRAAGRASICVQAEDRPYRYVTAEGPVTVELLGDATRDTIRSMASRYLGERAGEAYADAFSTPDEVVVTLVPERWRAEVLG